MRVRAKMKCVEIATRESNRYDPETRKTIPGTNEVVKLSAVMGDENKPWSQYTPQASVEMYITNPDAVRQFTVGGEYYVDFSPAVAIEAPHV
jgi:hypothetical protein